MEWRNCLGGNLRLFPESFVFPIMPLPNLVRMWYCGDVPSNIPPYKMLRTCDVSHLKHGKCKLSQMKKLMGHVDGFQSLSINLISFAKTALQSMYLHSTIQLSIYFSLIQ